MFREIRLGIVCKSLEDKGQLSDCLHFPQSHVTVSYNIIYNLSHKDCAQVYIGIYNTTTEEIRIHDIHTPYCSIYALMLSLIME